MAPALLRDRPLFDVPTLAPKELVRIRVRLRVPMAGAIPGRLGRVCLAYSTRYHPRLPVEVCGGRRAAFWAPDKSEASSCESRSVRNLRRLSRRVDCIHFRRRPTMGTLVGIDPPKSSSKETRTVPSQMRRHVVGLGGLASVAALAAGTNGTSHADEPKAFVRFAVSSVRGGRPYQEDRSRLPLRAPAALVMSCLPTEAEPAVPCAGPSPATGSTFT